MYCPWDNIPGGPLNATHPALHGYWGWSLFLAALLVLAGLGALIWFLIHRRGPRCPACRTRVEEVYLRCPECGHTLKEHCPHCHHLVNTEWKYCPCCRHEQQEEKPSQAEA